MIHVLWLLIACSRPQAPANPAAAPASRPDIVLHGVTLRSYKGSERSVTAKMPSLSLQRESTNLTAEAVTATLASGSVITAATVSGNANEGRLLGLNGVTLLAAGGVSGHAPSATYEKTLGPQGGAHGEAGVHLEHPSFTLDATSFTADFDAQRARFEHPKTVNKGLRP